MAKTISKPNLAQILRIFTNLVLPVIFVNAILFFLGKQFGAFPETAVAVNGESIGLNAVIIGSFVGSVLCTILFIIINTFAKSPIRWTLIIGYGLLIVTFYNPLMIANWNWMTFLTLNAMHVVVALPFINAFINISRDALLEVAKK
jgi:hypothetical protein